MARTIKQKLDRYVDAIHEMLQDQLDGLRTNPDRQVTKNRTIFARMLGQVLFDAPNIYTGMATIGMIERKLNDFKTKPIADHHNGRQNGGERLLQLVDRALYMNHNIDRRDVEEIVIDHCQVHYTTASENATLRRHQKQCNSEAAYRRAGYKLVQAADLFSKTGRQTEEWRNAMRAKYQPIVDEFNNPTFTEPVFTITLPPVIN